MTRHISKCAHEIEHYLKCVTVRSIDDITPAAEAMREFSESHGFRAALCADVANTEMMVDSRGGILAETVFGWCGENPRWWANRYLGLESPLALACRYESDPFWVNSAGFHGPSSNPYLSAIDMRGHFLTNKIYRSAIVVPVHLPFAQVSANSFHPIDAQTDDLSESFAQIGSLLGLFTRRFIAGYVATMRDKRRIPSACELTKREVECLRWAAIGKTDREIGIILRLSHAAVRYHVQRAGDKLNAVNRAQTVFKAGQLGFLGANS